MLANLIGFALVFGLVAGVAYVTRSILASLIASLALSTLVLGSFAVQLGSEVASFLDYAREPKDPVLVVLASGDRPIAALWVKTKEMFEAKRLRDDAASPDPTISKNAKEEMKRRWAPDLPDDFKGMLPPSVTQNILNQSVATMDPAALGRLAERAQHSGWDEAAKGSFRLIRLDVAGPRKLLEGKAEAATPVMLPSGVFHVRFKVPYVLECFESRDCDAMLADAMRDPTRLIAEVEGRTDIDAFFNEGTDAGAQMKGLADYIPKGAVSNLASALLIYGMAVTGPAADDPAALSALIRARPIEIYPGTPISRLFRSLTNLAGYEPVTKLAMKQLEKARAAKAAAPSEPAKPAPH